MISKIKAKGSPVTIDAVCKACKPPPTKRTAAIVPSAKAQKIRWPIGESIFPPEVRLSTTKEPESEEVTKNPAINITPITLSAVAKGNCSRNTKRKLRRGR